MVNAPSTPDTSSLPPDPLELAGLNLNGYKAWASTMGDAFRDVEAAFADCPATVEHIRRTLGVLVPETLAAELALQCGAAHKPDPYLEMQYPALAQTHVSPSKTPSSFFTENIS